MDTQQLFFFVQLLPCPLSGISTPSGARGVDFFTSFEPLWTVLCTGVLGCAGGARGAATHACRLRVYGRPARWAATPPSSDARLRRVSPVHPSLFPVFCVHRCGINSVGIRKSILMAVRSECKLRRSHPHPSLSCCRFVASGRRCGVFAGPRVVACCCKRATFCGNRAALALAPLSHRRTPLLRAASALAAALLESCACGLLTCVVVLCCVGAVV